MLEFISTSRKHPWPPIALDPMFKPREKEVVFNIASNILVPLCEEVLLEKRAQGTLSFYLSRRPPTAPTRASSVGESDGSSDQLV